MHLKRLKGLKHAQYKDAVSKHSALHIFIGHQCIKKKLDRVSQRAFRFTVIGNGMAPCLYSMITRAGGSQTFLEIVETEWQNV